MLDNRTWTALAVAVILLLLAECGLAAFVVYVVLAHFGII